MKTERQKILDKISKLLAMSEERGASTAEALIALGKAQELMRAHSIAESELEGELEGENVDRSIGRTDIHTNRQRKTVDSYIRVVLQKVCNVRIVFSSSWNERQEKVLTYAMFGSLVDCQYGEKLYSLLRTATLAGFMEFCIQNKRKPTEGNKNSYFSGLKDGFLSACEKADIKAFSEASLSARQSYGLVVIDQTKAITSVGSREFSKHKVNTFSKHKVNTNKPSKTSKTK